MRSPLTVGDRRRLASFVVLLALAFVSADAVDCPPGAMRGFPEDLTSPCYLYERFPTQFVTAERLCRMYGAHLVSIEDDFVNAFVAQGGVEAFEIMTATEFWIGAHDLHNKSVWNWADDQPWAFTKWQSGEPDLGPNETRRCVAMQLDEGWWRAADCFDRKPYVCEFDPNEAANWTTTPIPLTTRLLLTTQHAETTAVHVHTETTPERVHTSIGTPTPAVHSTTPERETTPPATQTTTGVPVEPTQPERQTSTTPAAVSTFQTTPPVDVTTSEQPTSSTHEVPSSSAPIVTETTSNPAKTTTKGGERWTTTKGFTLPPAQPSSTTPDQPPASSAAPSIATKRPASSSTAEATSTQGTTTPPYVPSSSAATTAPVEETTDPPVESTSTAAQPTTSEAAPSTAPAQETTGPADPTTVQPSTPTTTTSFSEETTIIEVDQTSTLSPTTLQDASTRLDVTTDGQTPSTSQFVTTEQPIETTTIAETTPVETTTEEPTTQPTSTSTTTTPPPTTTSTSTTTTTTPKIIYPCPRDWLYDEENDMCYFAMESHGWKADKLNCDLMSSSLVSIHSPLEGSKIKRLLFEAPKTEGKVDATIGLYEALEDGARVWKWVDESELNWTNWAPGFPAESDTGDLRCATFFTNTKSTKKQGQWKTVNCDSVQAQAACSKAADWSHFPRGAGAKARRPTRAERQRVKQIPL
ncbi:C-type lectin domain-containing protein [Aphelenchoides fujianensis]|nr:C-type lectin domain-containing protein [Aphelenchoides fujianensis]